jgi:DEAD/DEAH box helicase domain-containing protein
MARLDEILKNLEISIADLHIIPERSAQYRAIPDGLHESLREYLSERYPDGLYSHQSVAIQHLLDGQNVCLETSTSSGKSLVFSSFGVHTSIVNPDGLTIAVYPTKALIEDQLQKWKEIAEPFDLRVGRVDGDVTQEVRGRILETSNILLMTPDVLHAWLLRKSFQHEDRIQAISMIILDEAHTYSGVFGTNVAYLMRRLSIFAPNAQVVTATATVSDTKSFIETLTGKSTHVVSKDQEGHPVGAKQIYLADSSATLTMEAIAKLIRDLARSYDGKFIAFIDSRKSAEVLTARAHRIDKRASDSSEHEETGEQLDQEFAELHETVTNVRIENILMTYRAGYEDEDRTAIQQALNKGKLRGVVSTSALELGVDIGEIDLVVLLNTPPNTKSFWQRFGRAGRRQQLGECLILDTRGSISREGLSTYLSRVPERNYIYMDNKYIQFTQALCALSEVEDKNAALKHWQTMLAVPESFLRMLQAEVHENQRLDRDLFQIKQSAGDDYHLKFSMRYGEEDQYRIIVNRRAGHSIGSIGWSQVLREAYPEGIYYHSSKPYVVRSVNKRKKEIHVDRTKYYTSSPKRQAMVFPDYSSAEEMKTSDEGFIIECEVQVTERVTGFTLHKGAVTEHVYYGQGLTKQRAPLVRYLQSTGVLWSISSANEMAEAAARLIMDVYLEEAQVHADDIGIGRFHSRNSPLGKESVNGLCIYDAVNGGLRLTQQLYRSFVKIVRRAIDVHAGIVSDDVLDVLRQMAEKAENMRIERVSMSGVFRNSKDDEWITVVRRGEPALYVNGSDTREVVISGYSYTKNGMVYRYTDDAGAVHTIPWNSMVAVNGVTRTFQYNTETGEEVYPDEPEQALDEALTS